MELGRYGIWTATLWEVDLATLRSAASSIEGLGFGAVWIPSSQDIFERCREMLSVTDRLTVATGIASIWHHEPAEIVDAYHALAATYPGRFLLGLGVSHALSVNPAGVHQYQRPIARLRAYLDAFDASPSPLPVSGRVLAALGPRMLALARGRTAGAHPYLVTPEHTREAREILGPERTLAVEQAVVLEAEPTRARSLARAHLAYYAARENYLNSWRRLGFTDEDFAGGCSDRLVDGLVAWGDDATVRARLEAHLAAGANHVCVQVIEEDQSAVPIEGWKRLAGLVFA